MIEIRIDACFSIGKPTLTGIHTFSTQSKRDLKKDKNDMGKCQWYHDPHPLKWVHTHTIRRDLSKAEWV